MGPSRWLLQLVVVLLAPVLACGGDLPAPPPPPAVSVAAVPERDISEWDEFTGRLEAVDAVEIRPRVSGFIQRVAFAEGKEVRKGDLLFEIDPRPYAAELARAEAEVEVARTRAELAKRDVERARRLVAVQAISKEEFDTRTAGQSEGEAAVRAAEAAVATTRLNLDWTRVHSPISGRVGRAEVTEGNLVEAGPPSSTLLTTVVSLDPIYVYFEGDEQTYLKYAMMARAGERQSSRDKRNPVFIGLANEEGFPHEGYMDFVDNQLNPESGTIRARAVLSNRERFFTPGLFARIKLVGSGRYRATLIQDRAVGTDQDKKFVLVLKPDSTVEYRAVEIGRLVDGLRIVQKGLKPGEQIVVNGLQRARPGMKVSPTLSPMDTSTAPIAADTQPAPDSSAATSVR